MGLEVMNADLGHLLNTEGKFKNIKFEKGKQMVTVELDNITKVDDKKNVVLIGIARDRCWDIVSQNGSNLAKVLKNAYDKEENETKRNKLVADAIEKFHNQIDDELINAAMKVFSSHIKDKKDYKIYKVKQGLKLVINGAGLAASITLTAVAGWSGAGTVVGAVGMVRSAAGIIQQCLNLSKESMDIYKRILTNVGKLKLQLDNPNFKTNTLKQSAGTVINKVFAVEIQSLVITVDGIESDVKLMKNKVVGNRVNAANLGPKIQALLEAQDDLIKEIKKLEKLKDDGKISKEKAKELDKLKKALEKNEKILDPLLINASTLMEYAVTIEGSIGKLDVEIKNLKSKYNPNVVKGVGLATDFLLAAGSFVGGNFSDPAKTIQDLHKASEVVKTSLSLVNDGLGTIKDIGQSLSDLTD